MISIAQPKISKEEIAAVNEVLASGLLAQGPKVAKFEQVFAEYCGTKYAVAMNSGTAAIHAALYAVGISEGDEVITVPFSFIATINPILMLGAKPVLVDIDPTSFNLDIAKVEKAITDKTKAIMPVHLYGQPCDMTELRELADKYDLKIIEDACQAVGADYKGKKAGNLGDLGCFSLYATKNIMCGEGGVVTTNDKNYVTLMKQFRQHGMSAQYEYVDLGFNYRMTDLHAAIASEQLKKADKFNDSRQNTAKIFDKGLKHIPGLVNPKVSDGRTHVYHQYTIRITEDFALSRDDFVAQMREKEVGVGVYYPKPLHAFEHIAKLGYKLGDFPVAEKASKVVISLPVHPGVSEDDANYIVRSIKELAHA